MLIIPQREAMFFARNVTHVITNRPIPPESGASQPETKKSVFDVALQKTYHKQDVLLQAREMGIKIWPAEKLQRMLDTMFNTDTGEQAPHIPTRHAAGASQKKAFPQADLQTLLENEKLNGPLDRDHSVATQDMLQLRGCYIYIHDMDEITRPVMVREYPKVHKKEEGKWPQFRLSGHGKCPFVEDPHHVRKQQEQDTTRAVTKMTRAATTTEARQTLVENNNLARRATTQVMREDDDSKPLDPPKMVPAKRSNTDGVPPMFGSAQASIRQMPRFAGGEPVASGIQPSNVTSAIRSQMISSTAAAPGARAQSKEVNQLKRKVLEKHNSAPSANSGHSSAMNDMRAALNQESAQPARAAKKIAQENLGFVREDHTPSEEEKQQRKAAAARRRKVTEKELKPGYCENCRDKFNDFDEHVVSRKHRKFAATPENWAELDALLAQLARV
jgi:regulatory subunit for Cdc7p protein kinase